MRAIQIACLGLVIVVVLSASTVASAASEPPGMVAAWGYDHDGQLGDGTTINSDVPLGLALAPGLTVTAVAAGERHSLALLSNGTVLAWGAGAVFGSAREESDVPVAVSGLSGVAAISTSASHSLALLSNGTVMAWGANDYGDLGDGTTKPSLAPVAVRLPSGVTATAVAAGEYDSLALLSNGAVMAWGYNYSGQLGDGTTNTSDVPVAVSMAPGAAVSAIAAGAEANLALLSDGTVVAWGSNSFGLLGDGTREGPERCGEEGCGTTPVAVSGLSGVTAVSMSSDVSMALLENGAVLAWGSNYDGQLGDGTTEPSYVPVPVSALSGVTAISAGPDVSMALLEDGTVMAWGYNGYGGLGDGASTGPESCGGFSCSRTAVAVSGLSGATAISTGPDHALAIGVPPPRIATTALPEGRLGAGYSQMLDVIGGHSPYTWALIAGALPAGLRLNTQSGAIVGTPTAAGASSFTVEVADASAPTPQTAAANLSITVLGAAEQAAEYGRCAAQKQGGYTGSNCQTKATKADRGKFEWMPGPAATCVAQKKGRYSESKCETVAERKGKPRGSFEAEPGPGYSTTTGTLTLETPGLGGKVVCAAGIGSGEVTGAKTGVERITFTGCEASGRQCTSEGPDATPSGRPGAIVTNLLEVRLVGPVQGQVWSELASAEHEPYLFEFGCEGTLFRTIGQLGGVQAGDVEVSSPTSTTTFAAGAGEQALYTELSETAGASWVGPESSTATTLATNTAGQAIEIKT